MRGRMRKAARLDFAATMARTVFCACIGGASVGSALAADSPVTTPTASRAAKQHADEQSILVTPAKPSATPEAVQQALGARLEPIANVSEYEPDLAEPKTPSTQPKAAAKAASKPSKVPVAKSPEEVNVEAVSFHGITPGVSHRRDVLLGWGDPRTEDTMSPTLNYRFDKLKAVDVDFMGNTVDAVIISLEEPLTVHDLNQRLGLEAIQPVEVRDEKRNRSALVYPERGVTLGFAPPAAFADDFSVAGDASSVAAERLVEEIVIEPIRAAAFELRAEKLGQMNMEQCVADLEQAAQLNSSSAHSLWLLAQINLKQGKPLSAERKVAEACEMEPENHEFHLLRAQCLQQLASYDRAVEETRTVLEATDVEPLVRAQALYQMGTLASLGSSSLARRSVPLHTKAIEIADNLTHSDDAEIRAAAHRLLVDAHLAMAVQISQGNWQEKDVIVPQWIERASAWAEGLIAEDPRQLGCRLQVAVGALTAAANFEKPINPLLWVGEVEETAGAILQRSPDPLTVSDVDWQMGLAYYFAAQIEHRRSEPDSAERLGLLADEKLSALAVERSELPDTHHLIGRLYFQLGAVQAVHHEDHQAACDWYKRAAEPLLRPVPITNLALPQQHGDALVSMGVSYWNTGQRDRAVEITRSGVDLIEQAVEDGALADTALEVPYGNLSAMYQAQGQSDHASRYLELAKKHADTHVARQAPRGRVTR